jgi:hypothetical protein
MKKSVLLILLAVFGFSANGFALTRTSIANGNWNNPAIWSPAGVPQLTDDIIIINSQVSFNQHIIHGMQEFRINQGASLISTSLDTISLGCDLIVIDGYLEVSVAVFSPVDSAVNSGIIRIDEMLQSGLFINRTSGVVCVDMNLVNSDNLVNNGSMSTENWINSAQVTGSGKYCVGFNFTNTGTVTGSGDICDATPGGFGDINMGTIASSITNCQTTPCLGCLQPNAVYENNVDNSLITLSPNPVNGLATITLNNGLINDAIIEIVSIQGKLIKSVPATATQTEISTFDMEAGIYICRLIVKDQTSAVLKFVVQQ